MLLFYLIQELHERNFTRTPAFITVRHMRTVWRQYGSQNSFFSHVVTYCRKMKPLKETHRQQAGLIKQVYFFKKGKQGKSDSYFVAYRLWSSGLWRRVVRWEEHSCHLHTVILTCTLMVVTELTAIADRKIIAINAASLVHSHETDSAVCQQFASLVQPGQVHCIGIEEVTSGLPLPARPMTAMMRTVVKLEQAGFCEAYCWVAWSAQRLRYGVNHPGSNLGRNKMVFLLQTFRPSLGPTLPPS